MKRIGWLSLEKESDVDLGGVKSAKTVQGELKRERGLFLDSGKRQ